MQLQAKARRYFPKIYYQYLTHKRLIEFEITCGWGKGAHIKRYKKEEKLKDVLCSEPLGSTLINQR
jgi:hypothetical protein